MFHRVQQYDLVDAQAPPLTVIHEFVRDATAWLEEDPGHVVAVHCKAGKGRTGTLVCALLLYLEFKHDPRATSAEAVLARFAKARFKSHHNHKGISHASQRRFFLHYHQDLLAAHHHQPQQQHPDAQHQHQQPARQHSPRLRSATNGNGAGAGAQDPGTSHTPETRAAAAAGAGVARQRVLLQRIVLVDLPPRLLSGSATLSVWVRPYGSLDTHLVCHAAMPADGAAGLACLSPPARHTMAVHGNEAVLDLVQLQPEHPAATAAAGKSTAIAAGSATAGGGLLLDGDLKLQLFAGRYAGGPDRHKERSSRFWLWASAPFLPQEGAATFGRGELDQLRLRSGSPAVRLEYQVLPPESLGPAPPTAGHEAGQGPAGAAAAASAAAAPPVAS